MIEVSKSRRELLRKAARLRRVCPALFRERPCLRRTSPDSAIRPLVGANDQVRQVPRRAVEGN